MASRRNVRNLSRSFIQCKTLGHSWFETDAEKPSDRGVPYWLRCERCSTVRVDFVDKTDGSVLGRRYIYAQGYQRAKDDPIISRNDLRLMLIRARLKELRERKNG